VIEYDWSAFDRFVAEMVERGMPVAIEIWNEPWADADDDE
jgi:hypothetical protein